MSKRDQVKMRVWWIPQVPMEPFHVDIPVTDERGSVKRVDHMVQHAKMLLATLAKYDLFQFRNKIKPDYANVGGLEVFEDGEWSEWANVDGYDINEIMRDEEQSK